MNRISDVSFKKTVATQMAKNLEPAKIRERKFQELLSTIRHEKLRKIPYASGNPGSTAKAVLVGFYAKVLTFVSQEDFDTWLCVLPPDSQRILYDLTLHKCRALDHFEAQQTGGLKLMVKNPLYWAPALDARLGLDFLDVFHVANRYVLSLNPALCVILRPWFAYDNEELSFEACALDHVDETTTYNYAKDISASLPLLCEAFTRDFDVEEIMHAAAPMSKRKIAFLRSQSGFKPFPYTAEDAPDSLDLAARFLLAMSGRKPDRPDNGHDYIKNTVKLFFSGHFKDAKNIDPLYRGELFEYYVLLMHFKRKSSSWWNLSEGPPKSRKLFYELLMRIAKDGRWFSSARLARYLCLSNDAWFFSLRCLDYMYLKASSFQVDGFMYECGSYNETIDFYPQLLFHGPLYIEPLFKAYCYLFAALGLLEITQAEPPKPVTLRGKSKPISIFDSLGAVRVTDFGRWCFDLTKERPEIVRETCEAIADKELYLVTVRGASFERTLFLNMIGIKLGENRWRISAGSFIAGCSGVSDIEDRLLKFRRLIDSNPAPHWEQLFTRVKERADALERAAINAQVYSFAGQRDLFEELLRDSALSACALRAEGGFLIVPDKHKKKFLDLVAEHGVIIETALRSSTAL